MRKVFCGIALLGVLALSGCNDSIRPLSYDKGEYGGKPDTKLTKEQVDGLRQRSKRIAE